MSSENNRVYFSFQSGTLSKIEIRNFLVVSLERNKFESLFEAEDREMMKLVDQLYDHIFAELFDDDEDEIDIWKYQEAIDTVLGEDSMAQPLKDLFDEDKGVHSVTKQDIRNALTDLCRERLVDFQEGTANLEEERDEILKKTGGLLARGYIERIHMAYEEKRMLIEAEPDNKNHKV